VRGDPLTEQGASLLKRTWAIGSGRDCVVDMFLPPSCSSSLRMRPLIKFSMTCPSSFLTPSLDTTTVRTSHAERVR